MPKFKYVAVEPSGNKVEGVKEAKTQDAVVHFLHQQQYTVLNVEEQIDYFGELFRSKIPKVSIKNRVIFAKQLSTMLGAGISITQALEIVIQQTSDESLKKNIQDTLSDIQQSGRNLSDALEDHTKLFNEVQLNLIRAGEASGNIVEVLTKVSEDLNKTKELTGKIKTAMIYPVIIFVIVAVVVGIMVVVMVPAVEGLYEDFGVEKLPPVTAFLVGVSNFVTNPVGIAILVTFVFSAISSARYYYSTPSGRHTVDNWILKIPIAGELIAKIQITQFCRLVSMLLKSGVPIIETLNIVAGALGNIWFKEALQNASEDIAKGVPLAVPLSKTQVYPPLIVRMVSIGEETGKLDIVLDDMADFYEEEVRELSENLNKLMEPLILVIVGGIVAFLAVGIYLPIYSIGQNLT